MTNRPLMFVLVLALYMLVIYGSVAAADSQKAVIYYYSFKIQRITGIHEEEIEKLGCPYAAFSKDIERTLTKMDEDESEYDRRDVRAKIEMRGKVYFVDRFGFVRQGNRFFRLDKEKFVESIELASPCE